MNSIDGARFKQCLKSSYKKLSDNKDHVNELNVFPVPDGDTGTNMTLTMESALASVEESSDRADAIGKALGMGSLMGARGNSGVILSQLCRGLAEGLKGKDQIYLSDLPVIFQAATDKAYKAVMKPTEGTILTVAKSMSDYVAIRGKNYQDIGDLLGGVLIEANQTLQRTPEMLKELKEAGVVDAGGQGLVYLLAGFVEELTGKSTDELLEAKAQPGPSEMTVEDLATRLGAKEEYLLKILLANVEADKLSKQLGKLGQLHSMTTTKEGYLLRISTDSPDRLIKSLLKGGKILKLTLMSRDFDPASYDREIAEEEAEEDLKEYGFVSICSGDGFEQFFKQLLVDEIIEGGQTMNPSTRDIFEAVRKVPARTVFILPNNKNIIMAANQVQELEPEKRVIVIPSRSIPQGIEALFNFSEECSPEENEQAMTEALDNVKTGQVTYAIRDTQVHGLQIKKDEYIGLVDGDIVAAGRDISILVMDVLSRMVDDDSSMISLYPGTDADPERTAQLSKMIEEKYPDNDLVCQDGGQPIYSYILSVE